MVAHAAGLAKTIAEDEARQKVARHCVLVVPNCLMDDARRDPRHAPRH